MTPDQFTAVAGNGNFKQLEEPQLTFARFAEQNLARHNDWPRAEGEDADEWSLNEWAVAIAEETGELCGAIKRLNRFKAGYQIKRRASRVESEQEGIDKIKEEIGGIATYLDLLAQALGTNLGECLQETFNAVSEREGLNQRL